MSLPAVLNLGLAVALLIINEGHIGKHRPIAKRSTSFTAPARFLCSFPCRTESSVWHCAYLPAGRADSECRGSQMAAKRARKLRFSGNAYKQVGPHGKWCGEPVGFGERREQLQPRIATAKDFDKRQHLSLDFRVVLLEISEPPAGISPDSRDNPAQFLSHPCLPQDRTLLTCPCYVTIK